MLISEFDSCQPALRTTSAAKGSVNAKTLAKRIGEVEIAKYPNKPIKSNNKNN
jgi:hypothetical protein